MCLKQTLNTTFLITQVRKRHPKDIFDTSFLQPQDVFMKTAKTHFKDIFVAFFVSTRRCILFQPEDVLMKRRLFRTLEK